MQRWKRGRRDRHYGCRFPLPLWERARVRGRTPVLQPRQHLFVIFPCKEGKDPQPVSRSPDEIRGLLRESQEYKSHEFSP
jgi:hypothetical protein